MNKALIFLVYNLLEMEFIAWVKCYLKYLIEDYYPKTSSKYLMTLNSLIIINLKNLYNYKITIYNMIFECMIGYTNFNSVYLDSYSDIWTSILIFGLVVGCLDL